ncbi:hypothetical protein H4Q26_010092 [Puccinia striiformis f. sp. tritici PST-130]|nr:hypothetical protein H4Q26_010092 [Puccinia striiformis f. sp. tritici PST-130]
MFFSARRYSDKILLLCALKAFCCISLTVPRSSLTTAHGQSSGHGAGDLLIDQRISEDDFTVQQYKANFPQLHYPPIRKPKEAPKEFHSIEEKTREKIALESDFKSIMDGLDSLRKKQETEIESQLDKDPKSDLVKAKALIQGIKE